MGSSLPPPDLLVLSGHLPASLDSWKTPRVFVVSQRNSSRSRALRLECCSLIVVSRRKSSRSRALHPECCSLIVIGSRSVSRVVYTADMKQFISHQSALEFWRGASAQNALAGKKLRVKVLPTKPLEAGDLHTDNPWGLAMPLHILVGSANARKAARGLRCHISSGVFPGGSFIQGDSGLAISSPELCFVQMATELSLIELIELGFEFCGSYRLSDQKDPDKGFSTDLPLTSTVQLDSFLSKTQGLKGHKQALRALRFIANGSASPMETILTMLLTLPYRLGGYAFPMPQLNYPVGVSAHSSKASGRQKYCCDLYWPDKRIDVEYDSDAFHTKSEQIAHDAIRRNDLLSMGISVVTVSRKQLFSTTGMHAVTEVLRKSLSRRVQYPIPEFYARRLALRKQLFRLTPTS